MDLIASVVLLMAGLPLLLVAVVWRRSRGLAVFEAVHIVAGTGAVVTQRQLAGAGPWRSYPFLLNVLRGQVCLLGIDIQFALGVPVVYPAMPGLLSVSRLQQRMGLGFEDSQAVALACQGSVRLYLPALARALLCLLLVPRQPAVRGDEIRLFGVRIRNMTMKTMLEALCSQAQWGGETRRYAFVNADCLNIAYRNRSYRDTLAGCEAVFADGIGVRLGAAMTGQGVRDNLNGTDMFPRLCERLAEKGLGVYLLGGRDGVAEEAARRMRERFPNLIISGFHHGYFDAIDAMEVIDDINHSGAAVLLVSMGAPVQEAWIEKYQDHLRPRVCMGVGGLMDFYSGRVSRAPLWVRQIGMEWVWRLSQEPARLWRRYLIGNPLFLWRAWRERRAAGRAGGRRPGGDAAPWHPPVRAGRRGCSRHRRRLRLVRAAKRSLDILVSALAILMLSPLLLMVVTAIRLESPGPVFFKQCRVGKDGRPFNMWKLRSMYTDAEQRLAELRAVNEMQGGVLFKMKRDPRITRVGRLIRKASIDELPQLWNVLKGDMALVGPRPALPQEVDQYSLDHRQRLAARPGITCIWQVSGRSDIPFQQQVHLDMEYIHDQGFWTDVMLLVKTVPAVLLARGAY
ncbi:WecB/TagA/CpsF family glycosyltransferase [Alloalcanivorax sp. C16-2]|uniref:WecB/TagA/CpsF family glycosyltransferase n=1 Tax=Alloalcanivorax sp. C16-2 TaxID=3390052 RepID=UPI003970DFF0